VCPCMGCLLAAVWRPSTPTPTHTHPPASRTRYMLTPSLASYTVSAWVMCAVQTITRSLTRALRSNLYKVCARIQLDLGQMMSNHHKTVFDTVTQTLEQALETSSNDVAAARKKVSHHHTRVSHFHPLATWRCYCTGGATLVWVHSRSACRPCCQ
jgi:hypothetical protein